VGNNPILLIDPFGLKPNYLEIGKGVLKVGGAITAIVLLPEELTIGAAVAVTVGVGAGIGWGVSQIITGSTGNKLPVSSTTEGVITATTDPGPLRDDLNAANKILGFRNGDPANTVQKIITGGKAAVSIYESSKTVYNSLNNGK
jgi:hypothetical protein